MKQHLDAELKGISRDRETFTLSCLLQSRRDQAVRFRIDGKEVWSAQLKGGEAMPVSFDVELGFQPVSFGLDWGLEAEPYSAAFPEPTSGALINLEIKREVTK